MAFCPRCGQPTHASSSNGRQLHESPADLSDRPAVILNDFEAVLCSCIPLAKKEILCRVLSIASVALVSLALTACETPGARVGLPAKDTPASAATTATPLTSISAAPILLFIGTGTSP